MKTNGVQIFAVYSALMFIVVLGLTSFFKTPTIAADDEPAAKTDPASGTTAADVSTDEPPVEIKPTVTEEGDPVEADNVWAMFLVNGKNGVPEEYSNSIDTSLVYESTVRQYYMDSRIEKYVKDMFAAADRDGVQLVMVSAYRTNAYQQDLFDRSVEQRVNDRGMSREEAEEDTAREVQRPGFSEHNSGLAADIMSDEYTSMDDDGFENTEAFAWLSEHAPEYGFILRYPKGKSKYTDIIYEPWHYRFVGVYYAKLLTEKGLCLEEYFEQQGWLDGNGVAISHYPPGTELPVSEDEDKDTDSSEEEDTTDDSGKDDDE